MVLTEEVQKGIYPIASLENTEAVNLEKAFYNIDGVNIVDKSAAMQIPDYANNNGIPSNNSQVTETNMSQRLYRLNGNVPGSKMGLGITLKVMAGDQVDIMAKSYWKTADGNVTGTPSAIDLEGLLTNFVGNGIANKQGITGPLLNSAGGITSMLNELLNGQSQASTRPKAYLNWILFDENFRPVTGSGHTNSGFDAVGTNGELKPHSKSTGEITKNGYLYIYCSNGRIADSLSREQRDSGCSLIICRACPDSEAYRDDTYKRRLVGGNAPCPARADYYPFGLTMAGISSKALSFGNPENKYKWNKGSELQSNEFSDGGGLELYSTFYRSLDPQLGRFWQTDPKPDYSQSLYSAMSNNPILYNDPLGDTLRTSFRTGFLGIFGKKVTVTYDEKNQRWNNKDGSAYTGKTTKFANMVLNDLKTNQKNDLGNAIVTNLATDKIEHNIKKGDPNSNTITDPNIYYSGSVSDNQKILQGGKTNSSPSYVVLGHEMAHKFSRNLGIRNLPWFGTPPDQRGVDEYNAMYYENVLRQANGLPLRTAYKEVNGVTQGVILNAAGGLQPLPTNLASQSMNLPLYHALQTLLRIF